MQQVTSKITIILWWPRLLISAPLGCHQPLLLLHLFLSHMTQAPLPPTLALGAISLLNQLLLAANWQVALSFNQTVWLRTLLETSQFQVVQLSWSQRIPINNLATAILCASNVPTMDSQLPTLLRSRRWLIFALVPYQFLAHHPQLVQSTMPLLLHFWK